MRQLAIPLVLAAALVAAAPSASAVKARVWLAAASPVRVAGSGFASDESVAVKVTAGKVELKRTVSTTVGGRFSARWSGSIAGGCRSITVTARGSSGRAALWREVANDCGPPIGRL